MVIRQLLYSGSALDIYVLQKGTVSEVADFMESLPESELNKLSHLIDFLKDQGPPSNDTKFKNEGNGIYALKTTSTRVYGFFHGKRSFVLAIGFMKNKRGGKKVERRYCEQAEALRKTLA